MTDYNDGEWHTFGGSYPDGVHPKSLVTYVWHDERTGKCGVTQIGMAAGDGIAWRQVLKFRVTKPFREPRVIWVNEYPQGNCYVYLSAESAKYHATLDATRVAVRYVEAPE